MLSLSLLTGRTEDDGLKCIKRGFATYYTVTGT